MEKGQGKGTDTLPTDNVFTRKEYIEREAFITRQVEDYPAADVVARDCYDRLLAENDELRKERPVVRCKDCKYSAEARENDKGFLICVASGMDITDYDYCSYGERMDTVTECNHVKGGDGK